MSVHLESSFEANIEAHLVQHGWHQLAPSGYDKSLGLFPDEVITYLQTSQPRAWQQLVTRHGGKSTARQKFLTTLAKAITSRGTINVLRDTVKDSGVTIRMCWFRPANNLTPELEDRYRANRCGVVRQLHHSESNPADSLDLALVVNGIPVASAELKNPLTHQTVEHAMTQYRTDRNPNDLIFAHRTLVHFALDPHQVMMTTSLEREQTRFLPFNQGTAGPGQPGRAGNPQNSSGYQTDYLWQQVWQRDNWLDLLATFVHAQDGRILFPRFHQWHAVKSIVQATRQAGAGTDRLIQHSAGSGKSNTIAWTAHSLQRLHGEDDRPVFDKVVVITDRRVLDRQLQETVAGLDHTPGTIVRVDQHSSQLKEALEGNAARIIITTLQKFPVVAKFAAEDAAAGEGKQIAGKQFAVIVDEAHSSTTGNAVKQLKSVLGGASLEEAEAAEAAAEAAAETSDLVVQSALARGKQKNLSFFAFTATPKPKTLELFGELVEGIHRPFHTYSMRQAIDEGFILDVLANYSTYGTYYKLANASPVNDPEMDQGKARAALARFVSLHPYQLEQKAEVIVEHFRQKTALKIDGRAKAMVVTRSRLHAVRTKQALDAYITRKGYDSGADAMRTLVAFSGAVTDPEVPQVAWTEAGINGFTETQLPKRFRDDDYQVLVVAEKYQTGFDEPLLHTMYVDKKLAGVKAVQTLSRLNRVHPGKEDTFILDFANTADEIREAFEPFYEQTMATPTEPNILYTMHHALMSAGVLSRQEMQACVTALLSQDPAQQSQVYANVTPAVGRFVLIEDEDEQADFRSRLNHFCRAYAFVAQVMPWTDPELEELFLYGRVLLTELPADSDDPLPQLSKSVQLTHLRIAVTSDSSITLDGSDEPGEALPGMGEGHQAEPVLDKLSAMIAALNDKFGADLGEADKVWFDQQRLSVMEDVELKLVAMHNDRSQYELMLKDRLKQKIVDRHDQNQVLFNLFFEKPEVQDWVLGFLSSTYEEFRSASGSETA
ncbi:type I restriction endonuclease subunit R [Tessaracoccus sp. SD287]|uniref:type I restriction endonuclease subunit R n=1 Tax=Tessaracoccus sp. SD287 TaxID=2782008 RepID=UPI001A96ADA4|nr:DEAD/DEAH box helicase family protein [Tessaracoccus sp. SD287]MBO1030009.1 type I restriction endonuclease subunit R [Tessaracoccus sp. SD287]